MASKSLVLLGLFALLFVVSEVAAVSERQSGTVKSESEETVRTDQYGGGQGYNLRVVAADSCRRGCCKLVSPRSRMCARCCTGKSVQTQPGH